MNTDQPVLFAFCMLYGTASPLVKLTVLALYWRIFPITAMRRAIYVLGSMTAGWWVAIQLVTIFQCEPISKAWDTGLEGRCINQLLFHAWNSVPNCLLDFLIVILPMREILRLQTFPAQKAGLAGTFLLGGLVVVASAMRTWTEWDLIIEGVTNPISECCFDSCSQDASADEHRAICMVMDRHRHRGLHCHHRCLLADNRTCIPVSPRQTSSFARSNSWTCTAEKHSHLREEVQQKFNALHCC